jgi:uncharacterized protein YecE (DUF72 family)
VTCDTASNTASNTGCNTAGNTRPAIRCVWEPRGLWTPREVAPLCRELGLLHAVDPLVEEPVDREVAYFRLHGLGGFRNRYSDDQLDRLLDICSGYQTVYCIFNNADMLPDAARFCRRLTAAGLAVAGPAPAATVTDADPDADREAEAGGAAERAEDTDS